MKNLDTLKSQGQENISNLLEYGKQRPEEVKAWGVTIASGFVGVVSVTAVAKAVLAITTTLASPLVTFTFGAIGGGALGWRYMKKSADERSGSRVIDVESRSAEEGPAESESKLSESSNEKVETKKPAARKSATKRSTTKRTTTKRTTAKDSDAEVDDSSDTDDS